MKYIYFYYLLLHVYMCVNMEKKNQILFKMVYKLVEVFKFCIYFYIMLDQTLKKCLQSNELCKGIP